LVDEPDGLTPCLVGCSGVATASVPAAVLRRSVRAHADEDAEMLVVAPASGISRLDWLTNADDDARTDAAERADELAEAAPTKDVSRGSVIPTL
jgi:hypothetical protein